MENDDEYDVNNFTDEELFHLMDLNNPTDRELEAKLYLLIEKYEGNKNKLSVKMCKFFNDVFSHFFSTDDDDESVNEGFETQNKLEDKKPVDSKLNDSKIQTTAPTAPLSTVTSNYSKGLLNPLLKETIKRIVCIDSQYRDLSIYPNPSNFTFNLSDTLTDVVSLKLYSVQIPYTWYTISNDFGSNFFIINGNVEGINNGNFDYKVEIQPGNYQSNDFVYYINNSLQKLFLQNNDISFGTTEVSYNNVNAKLTMTLDIKIIYNETNYRLNFPIDPSYNDTKLVTSIPELLGYKYNDYFPFSIKTDTHISFDSNFDYTIDDSNNKFYIRVNQGTTEDGKIMDDSNNIILQSILIKLSVFGNVKTLSIIDDINKQLGLSPFIDSLNSSFSYVSADKIFEFKIRLNRKTVLNNQNIKTAIEFVDSQNNPLWVGNTSLFKFKKNFNGLNQIESDTSNLRTLYEIPLIQLPRISFLCKNPLYTFANKHVDISGGKFTSLELTTGIQDKLSKLKSITSNSFDISFDTNQSLLPYLSSNINYEIPYYNSSSYIKNFEVDITGSFLSKLFKFDNETLNSRPTSTNNNLFNHVFEKSFISGINGIIITEEVVKLSLKFDGISIFTNKEVVIIPPRVEGYSLATIIELTNTFFDSEDPLGNNVSFKGSKISISGTNISGTNSNFECNLTLKVNVILKNKDFELSLNDTNNMWTNFFGFNGQAYNTVNNSQFDISGNRVVYNLSGNPSVFDSSGNLLNSPLNLSGILPYASSGNRVYDLNCSDHVLGMIPIPSNLIFLTNLNNYFTFKAVVDSNGGVYTNSTKYDIIITLTLKINNFYTREDIVSNINLCLLQNEVTFGSYLSEELGKTLFKVNINKNFTAQEFRIVFFDNTFTRCNFGKSSIDSVKWDTTLGWILGFRNQTQYILSKSNENNLMDTSTYYTDYPNQAYSVNTNTNIVTLTGDTSININLYNYLLVVLDDYCQNHLNDGLVTVTKTDYDIPLPSYANRTTYQCDASGQLSVVNGNLTSKQLYSANQILNTKQINQKKNVYSSGPFTQDIFALIPIKTAGLSPGQTFIDFSGTLQNQERTYFGPVNIRKMTIQLLNDKGSTLDLNGANWSFSFIAEQLYNSSRN